MKFSISQKVIIIDKLNDHYNKVGEILKLPNKYDDFYTVHIFNPEPFFDNAFLFYEFQMIKEILKVYF